MARKILIIDDEDDIREVAALSLESVAGWDVVTASSGAQGLTKAAQEKPDAIVLDVMMPGMDGLQVCERLRESDAWRGIPVVLRTAKDEAARNGRTMSIAVAGCVAASRYRCVGRNRSMMNRPVLAVSATIDDQLPPLSVE